MRCTMSDPVEEASSASPDLHQLVVAQRAVELRDEVRAQAALADQDDWIAVVAEPAKMLALDVRKSHREGRAADDGR